ncbi:hypothetical protein B0H11DRAFT_1875330 [Mycena galericulata]|nr:hypothetical protein B0H11DRAFT_1875330 [Mycena galericulata]
MKDLAAVARTCRAFQGPALDFLWRYSTLLNLLRCMPSDLWAVDEVREVLTIKYYLDSLRPIHITDWHRVVVYARRIQHISSSDEDCDLSKIFPMISVCFPLQLFPNLRGLHWYHSGPQFQYIHLFLASSITSISFNAATYGPAEYSFLSKLGQDYPMLKDMLIQSGEIQPISDSMRTLTSIESISVRSVDQEAFQHLCRLPTLTSLFLTLLSPSLPLLPSADIRLFPVLRKLSLGVYESGDMTCLLERCDQTPLTSLNIYMERSTAAETHNLFTSLSTSVSHTSLTHLSLFQNIRSQPDIPIRGQSLHPLLSFTNLLSITLIMLVEIDLDNATISDLARAWPHIEQLALSSHYPSTSRRATLQCLHSFAGFCPRLTNLTINFDGTDLVQGIDCHVLQHALTKLNVVFSPISTAMPVAQFISAMFPNLRKVDTARGDQGQEDWYGLEHIEEAIRFHRLWKEVESLLPSPDL